MESQIRQGYLVLADISGYTSFMARTELDHSQDIVHAVLSLVVEALVPPLRLAEVEGDAVFGYALAEDLSRGELLLEAIEATYEAFRDRRRTMEHNAVCPCEACRSIPTLDLKFVTHYGEFVLQDVSGRDKPVGSCVNVVHRLLKNSVCAQTGWQGYSLLTRDSLEHLGLSPSGGVELVERYEHLGEVTTWSYDLDAHYRATLEKRSASVDPSDADVVLHREFAVPPCVVWDWINDPVKRTRWMKGSSWTARERPGGRTGPAAQNHCATARVIEQVVNWQPFRLFTVRCRRGVVDITITGELEPSPLGTRMTWRVLFEGPVSRRLVRPVVRLLASRVGAAMERHFLAIDRCLAENEHSVSALSRSGPSEERR